MGSSKRKDTPPATEPEAVDLGDAPPEAVASDLSDLREALAEQLPPPPPRPAPRVASASEEGADDDALEQELEAIAEDPAKLDALSAEELADIFEDLIFGMISESRGPHWEIDRKRAMRLGKYARKTLDGYGGVPESWKKHVPALILAWLLGVTVFRRVKIDRDLANPPLQLHRSEPIPVAEESAP